MNPLKKIAAITAFAVLGFQQARASDILTITIPKHSQLTPVQRLNRQGVEAVKQHHYEKAASLFYKAYLFDPGDPFTLNNLGYISELDGELDRASKFYALASEQGSNANIDMSSSQQLQGKPLLSTFEGLQDVSMRVNHLNVEAMVLLSEHRGAEAIALLQKALPLDERNLFTLNNLGVANETIGDYVGALNSYRAVADEHSSEAVIETLDRSWRGRPVSEMAAANAKRLQERIKKIDTAELSASTLTIHGVAAANRNDWTEAKEDFVHAFTLTPVNAFSLNNRGYVAEMDGDLETAEYFYRKAQHATGSSDRVGHATQQGAEGQRLSTVATDSNHDVDDELDRYSESRHRQTGSIELTVRGDTPGKDSGAVPAIPTPSAVPPAAITTVPQTK